MAYAAERKEKKNITRIDWKGSSCFLFQQIPSLEVQERKRKITAHSYILTLNDRRLPVYLEAKTG